MMGVGMSADLREIWTNAGGSTPAHWDFVRFEDLLADPKSIAVGVMYPGNHYASGVPLIKVSDVKNGAVVGEPDFRISETVNHEYRRTSLSGNELLITLVGNPGDCAIIDESMAGWNAARALAVVRLKDPTLRTWLRYVLLSSTAKHLIDARLNTTVQKTLNLKDIRSLPIPVAPQTERNAIVGTAAALENKINVNHRINHTLDQMAQAIFKSWFVDFEPVKAKIAVLEAGGSDEDALLAAMQAISGKGEAELTRLQTEQPEQYAELRATAELFPSAMQDSELGEIPEGWDVKSAESQFQITIGKTPPRKEPEWFSGSPDHVKWLSIRKMGEGNVFATDSDEYLTQEAVDKFKIKICPEGTVLLSFKLTLGRVVIAKTDMATNEAIAHFRISTNSPGSYWTYLCLSQFDYSTLGSTSSIATAVNSKTIKQMPLIIPDDALLQCFEKIVTPIFEGICNYQLNKASLANLRDSLLPKLLSGELSLSDAEGQLAEEAEPANV